MKFNMTFTFNLEEQVVDDDQELEELKGLFKNNVKLLAGRLFFAYNLFYTNI